MNDCVRRHPQEIPQVRVAAQPVPAECLSRQVPIPPPILLPSHRPVTLSPTVGGRDVSHRGGAGPALFPLLSSSLSSGQLCRTTDSKLQAWATDEN